MHLARPFTAAILLLAACGRGRPATDQSGCDASLELPKGFCATIVADTVGHARQIAVRSNGDLFVARLSSRRDSGGVTVVRGDSVLRFGAGSMHGVVLASDSTLYASTAHEVLRFHFPGTALLPGKRVDTIVAGLPSGDEPTHTLLLDANDNLLVSIGASSVGCMGKTPCPELETGGGIWRFSTGKRNQTLKDGVRIATGLRSPIGMAIDPSDGSLYVATWGPDSLHERFPSIDPLVAATHPAGELIRVASIHADYGWPYCYYDVIAGTRVESPEYGGDGKAVGNCDRLIRPVVPFPAHWEPMAIAFPNAKTPSAFRSGVFVAFHGSAHRDPLPQDGYEVVFVPMSGGVARMDYVVLADGFAGPTRTATGARHRPSGIAVGPDGSIYVSDDKGGRIWRIRARP